MPLVVELLTAFVCVFCYEASGVCIAIKQAVCVLLRGNGIMKQCISSRPVLKTF